MSRISKIYLDHNATTPVASTVLAGLPGWAREFGNPSSIHFGGRGPKTVLREARQALAQGLAASPLELIFNSGGSESNSTVVHSVVQQLNRHPSLIGKSEFITTEVEHPSILRAFQNLQQRGFVVHFLRVSDQGELDLDQLQRCLSVRTALVSVMAANNETGVLYPIQKIARLAHDVGALVHSDCVQMLGKGPLNLRDLEVDYASFSAHKFYALKGTGVLYVRKGAPYESLILGGGQERHRRGGTENTLGIAALGEMAKMLPKVVEKSAQVQVLRDQFESWIVSNIPGVSITSAKASRLGNTSSLVIDDVDGETLLMNLDLKGFAVSTGAACSSGNPEPSPVLIAMGLGRQRAQSSLRVSLGWETTKEQIELFQATLEATVFRIREIRRRQHEEVL